MPPKHSHKPKPSASAPHPATTTAMHDKNDESTLVQYNDSDSDSGDQVAKMLAEMAKSNKAYKRHTRSKLEKSYLSSETTIVNNYNANLDELSVKLLTTHADILKELCGLLERRSIVVERLEGLTRELEEGYEEQKGLLEGLVCGAGGGEMEV